MRDNKLEKLRNREKIFLIIGCVFLGQAGSNFDFGQYVTAIVFFAIWVACTIGVFITSSKITDLEYEKHQIKETLIDEMFTDYSKISDTKLDDAEALKHLFCLYISRYIEKIKSL